MKLLADVGEQSPIGCAVILGKLGGLRAMRGDFERARADVERAREISAELGLAIYLATQEFWGVERLAGDLDLVVVGAEGTEQQAQVIHAPVVDTPETLGDPMVASLLRREFQYGTSPRSHVWGSTPDRRRRRF